jgi:Bacteriophage head to tail connecting protein
MTAREIEERHSEKVLALGPVMERLNDELFDPLIKRVFGILFRRGAIKPPPPALAGQDFPQKIEYTSILAQASKLVGTANIERVAQFTSEMAQTHPDIVDKFNADEALDTYSEMHGINPNIILTKEQVKPLRDLRAKKEQAAQMAQMAKPMKEAAEAGRAMGDTNSGGVQDLIKSMVGG